MLSWDRGFRNGCLYYKIVGVIVLALPVDLVAEFAKTTYDDNKVKQPVVAYATAVINQEGYFVRLDGSDLTTPAVFAVKAHNGDRVLISIQNRTVVVTNNITTPSITTGILEANTGIIVHGYFTTNEDRVVYNDQNHSGLTFSAGGIGAHGNSGYWYVTDNGNLYASNADISGTITATSGAIANFKIDSSQIYSNNKSNINHTNSGVYVGTDGIALGANSPFKVTSAGVLTAMDANITGSITATSGYLGSASNGFTIDEYGIYSGAKSGNTNGYITLSNDDFTRLIGGISRSNLRLAIGSGFGVTNSGTLYASNADITGKITATSGSISGNLIVGTIDGQLIGSNTIGLDQLGTEVTDELNAAIQGTYREYTTTSTSSPPGASANWSVNPPPYVDGQYIWERTVVTYGSGSTDTTDPVPLTGNSGPAGATGASGSDGKDAAILRIDSSRGNQFINKDISTVLTVTIFYGSLKITDITALRSAFGSGAYLQWYWKRISDNSFGVILATDSKLSDNGFSMTLTPNDVDRKVTFMCELVV